ILSHLALQHLVGGCAYLKSIKVGLIYLKRNSTEVSLCFLAIYIMFKGFEKVKDIQYVYTPVFSSLCGVKLDSNKVHYLLSGKVLDEKVSIGLCDLVEPWDNLSMSQKKNLNYRYQMGCDCKIATCYSVPCATTTDNECLWTDWLLVNSLSGEQARQYACIKSSDSSCNWYRSSPPPENDFMDMSDP
uniref:Metalloproteinase inhibitor 4 n=1 Tax=Oncorhynchus tshawytscha TaxID=74940 RepID=A0A8C8HS22_ONCTS